MTMIQEMLLVSTNDDRIRLYQMEDYSLQCKYKGLRNRSMQIKVGWQAGRLVSSEAGRLVGE